MATYFGFDPYVGNEPFVFISYKSEESEKAAVFAKHLSENGINVFYDAALTPGDKWAQTLLDTIGRRGCMGVILMVSERSLKSQPVIDEVSKAHYSRKTVLGVFLENITHIDEPMRTYLSGTHSVLAWQLDEEAAKQQVLLGAQKMLAGDKTPQPVRSSMDELYKKGRFFMMNAHRSKSPEDIANAQKNFRAMTEQDVTDYRGWLGLAMCECAYKVEDIDTAVGHLGSAAGYYSYVVSAGADETASPDYTYSKSEMWYSLLMLIQSEIDRCVTSDSAAELLGKLCPLEKRMGHTYGDIAQKLNDLVGILMQKNTRLHEAEKSAQLEWEIISDTEVALAKVDSQYTGELVIPEEVDGHKVTIIRSEALKGCDGLTAVILPDSVAAIEEKAFAACTCLESVVMSKRLKKIGYGAFIGCEKIEKIYIPNGILLIDQGAFFSCVGLRSVNVSDCPNIGNVAFSGCTKLESVYISQRIKFIGEDAFLDCPNLTIYSTGGAFSYVRRYSRKHKIKYRKIKKTK